VAPPIRRLGIVNRGDAALRCLRTIKSLRAREGSDLRAVVLYTAVDRDAPFVRHADAAVLLPVVAGEVRAYLDHDLVIAALRRARVDAVWPGWGFVAEDPVFADRVVAEGMRFLGPSGEAMRALGDKIAAKQVAERAGVPVAPWSGGAVADCDEAAQCAARLGYPVMVKASAGGGGRGIRVVDHAAALPAALRAATAEAVAAFGDGRLFVERKVSAARHVEVQIAADTHGNVRALGARDCSVQRRHQKVIEEAPPPGLAPQLCAELSGAAVRLASAVGYVGLGTVEFLVSGEVACFLEMNPRLQVEHGVTEEITGLDLVELQIRIARGESLAGLAACDRGVAIEARVCAEDVDDGFAPAPGRIARFDPALGPGIRVDTGIATGSLVPAAFDSLVAKVIATGETREHARSRLASALRDLDLVIEGGASNAGYLVDLLESDEFRAGGVDVGWVDRRGVVPRAGHDAGDALVAAAILAYQRRRGEARLNFFADTTVVSPARVPPATGQEIDLSFCGVGHRLTVFALGSWRYRVHLDGRAVTVTLREGDGQRARLEFAGRTRRIAYDATEVGLRLELDARAYRFGWGTMGQVRASAPALVVAIQVRTGDRVAAGQLLGFLEAMKVEIAFSAPVAGVVAEIRATKGQLVPAGSVLLVIQPDDVRSGDGAERRLQLELDDAADPADALVGRPPAELLAAMNAWPTGALAALRDEVHGILLGYDADPARADWLAAVLASVEPGLLGDAVRNELAALAAEVTIFADIEQLFLTSPRISAAGQVSPSNASRLRAYLRRMRAGGAGIAEDFLDLLKAALCHYGVESLDHDDALERALLRVFATQHAPERRRQVLAAALRCLTALARARMPLDSDARLGEALDRIAAMRALVGAALADTAIEARAAIFDDPALERQAELLTRGLAPWLAEADTRSIPPALLHDLATAPRGVFDRIARWLFEADPRRQEVALSAWLVRTLAPDETVLPVPLAAAMLRAQRVTLPDGRSVIGATSAAADAIGTVERLCRAIAADAIEIVVPGDPSSDVDAIVADIAATLERTAVVERCTLSFVGRGIPDVHRTLARGPDGVTEAPLLGLHPETAARIGFARLQHFALTRLPARADIYCFHGRSHAVADDERIFVLAEVCGRSATDAPTSAHHVAAFERVFLQATRALRAARDPRRRLHWNRITISVAPVLDLGPEAIDAIAQRLAPATRHLGLEKVVARLRLRDRAHDGDVEPVELVVSDLTGSHMEIVVRRPRTSPLEPASTYERRVVEARRRRLVYPYEIVRMLTGGNGAGPIGTFEEHDIDAAGRAVAVAGRPFGENAAGVVFGIVSTPTEKVPEGMRRVLILSDPTRDMGALAAPECDRIVAALDLAEAERLPVEWIPVSSGARIAMDSGTENLDATARVARRIIEFTGRGSTINLIVYGVNVGAQSYWDALATMGRSTRGALVMTPEASMVLTGRAALEASGSVAAETEVALGGFERIMGPNGEAQYYAADLAAAVRTLQAFHDYTYVVPGERAPRRHRTTDPFGRDITGFPYPQDLGHGFTTVGDLFDDAVNPGRKRAFAMRPAMEALIDQDGGHLERWRGWAGAETAIAWDAHLGGVPICLIGIESQNVPREGHRPLDGPGVWGGGTLFPRSSKKVARAINAASGNRPVVILANLSGFDGSPESLRQLQLEYGAEIARAVVRFDGLLIFLVVSRYHGGAYVVFSKALNPGLRALAFTGSYASVIGGSAAAAVVLTREVRLRAAADPAVRRARDELRGRPSAALREAYERTLADATRNAQVAVAAEFDGVHTVERACRMGSLDGIIDPAATRPTLIRLLHEDRRGSMPSVRQGAAHTT
jgi:acetyl/propionyl-CoA carboxylase alpha subunit/acetyl-CoA carboxylase carboxyltransferase component